MKKFLLLLAMVAFATGMTFAQHGGGHPHGGHPGFPGDSTVVDSIGHPGIPHDSIPHDSIDHPTHPMDSLMQDSVAHPHHGHPFGGHHGGGLCDSTVVDSLAHGGCPFGLGDSTLIDSLGLGHHGHPFHGHHGHHGEGTCDSTVVVDSTVVDPPTKSAFVISKVVLYPNPVVNELSIDFSATSSEMVKIEIYTINGQLVRSLTIETSEGSNSERIDVSTLNNGNYLLRIEQGNSRVISRFIK